MRGCKLIIQFQDGTNVWINPMQIVKMVRTADGRYYIHLTNGETYEIDRRAAGRVEDSFADD